MNKIELARDLINFLDESPTQFHATYEVKKHLDSKGFIELKLEDAWKLSRGGKYYTCKNNSALVAFTVGKKEIENTGFKMIGAHTDSPGFRIKPNPEMIEKGKFLRLNTEVYGGPILNTWLDRPLSIAGRVNTVGENPLKPKEHLIDFKKPITIIPNIAIHMNREINSGFKLNPQKHTLPLLKTVNDEFEKEGYLISLLAKELGIKDEEILDFELFLYPTEKAEIVGIDEEFISSARLDDLAMVHAGIKSLVDSDNLDSTNVMIAFDNEEVGSETKQGAASPMLRNILRRITISLGKGEEEFYRALENSFLISADMAHSVHPNYLEKADPTNAPIINQGPVIKVAANQAYTTDSKSSSIYEAICKSAKVPVQMFTNRSDARGGSTIGPISTTQLEVSSVDMGNAMYSMHSVRELCGLDDQYFAYKSFLEFYNL